MLSSPLRRIVQHVADDQAGICDKLVKMAPDDRQRLFGTNDALDISSLLKLGTGDTDMGILRLPAIDLFLLRTVRHREERGTQGPYEKRIKQTYRPTDIESSSAGLSESAHFDPESGCLLVGSGWMGMFSTTARTIRKALDPATLQMVI